MKCKRRFMHGKRRRRSPIKNDVLDTTWADQVYAKTKVDADLTKKGYHTSGVTESGGSLRGHKKSKYHHTGDTSVAGSGVVGGASYGGVDMMG